MSPLAAAVEEARERGPLLDLTESNPTRCGLAAPVALLREVLAETAEDAEAARYTPEPKGPLEARRAVAVYHARRGVAVDPESVVLTAGTSEGYAHLFRLLADPGDVVAVPRPSYPLFELLAGLEGVRPAPYPLVLRPGSPAFAPDLTALEAGLSSRARAVLVVHPNNPTGSFLRRDAASALRGLCHARGLALVSDEVFADYGPASADAWPASLLPSPGEAQAPLSFLLSGISKLVGLPQLKLAWIAVAGPEALRREAVARLEVIADTFLSVSPPLARRLPRLLAGGDAVQAEVRARIATNLALLDAFVAETAAPVRRLPRDGGWYAVLEVAGADDEELALAALERAGVLVHPGYLFDFEEDAARLVLSLLPESAVFQRAAAALLAVVREAAHR